MKTSVKNNSKTNVTLTITCDAKELAAAEEVALVRVGEEVKAPGFRKGKAPLAVIKKQANPEKLAEETVNTALNKAIIEAFATNKLRPLDRPEVEVTKFVPGQEMEFTATVDVLPEVKLGDYKKIKLPKQEKVTIKKEQVEEITDRIRTDLAEKKPVERAAKEGDEVVIDFEGKIDGTAFDGGKGEAYPLTLGSGQFIPGFEEGVVGHKADETFDVSVSFPKDYHAKQLKGKKAVFTTTIKEVKEVIKPELTDEVAAKAGPYKTAKELLEYIETELKNKRESELKDVERETAVKALVEMSDIAVPEVLKKDQVETIERETMQNLMYRGTTLEQYIESQGFKDKDEWIEKEAGKAAAHRVQANLALGALADELNVTVDEAEIDAVVADYEKQYAQNPEMLKKLKNDGVRDNIRMSLRSDKALDQLIALNRK